MTAADHFGTALDGLIGRRCEPPECRVLGDGLAVHWFPTGARPGDTCLCGKTTMTFEEAAA